MRAIARSPWVRMAALATVGALALTACGGSDDSGDAAAEDTTAAETTEDAGLDIPGAESVIKLVRRRETEKGDRWSIDDDLLPSLTRHLRVRLRT